MIKASVIVPTFNRGYILGEAIQSILDQTYPLFEVIIVDDGSTDDTVEVVNRFKDGRVRLIQHSMNSGVAAARNSGLKAAQGDLISFLDSDDLWSPDKLALEVKFLAGHPEVDGVFTDLRVEGADAVPSIVRTCPVFAKHLASTSGVDGMVVPQRKMYMCMLQEMPMKIQATTIRRESLHDCAKFREDWQSGEDWEFLLRFTRTHRLGFIDRPLVIMRPMADSTLARYRTADALFLRDLFIREKQALRGDREARLAVRRAISALSSHLAYCYRDEGEYLDSVMAFLRGFRESGDFRLLARAVALPIPRRLRKQIKRLAKAMSL